MFCLPDRLIIKACRAQVHTPEAPFASLSKAEAALRQMVSEAFSKNLFQLFFASMLKASQSHGRGAAEKHRRGGALGSSQT